MKKILLILTLFCNVAVACAQMVIKEDGRVIVGRNTRPDDDMHKVLKMTIAGDNGVYNAGSKLAFGDFGRLEHYGWNVFIGEWDVVDSDILWLHGKNGIKITTLNGSRIVADWNANSHLHTPYFTFYDRLRADRIYLSSVDDNKTSVRTIDNALSRLKRMKALSFRYKTLVSLSEPPSNDEKELTDKEKKDIQNAEAVYKADQTGDARYGFMAKEVEKVFPELVVTDDQGNQYVDYIGLIPVMVSAIQELFGKGNNGNNGHGKPNDKPQHEYQVTDYAILYQAKSYKSTSSVTIEYYIPKNVRTAELHFLDLNGSLVASYHLYDHVDGKFTLPGGSLEPGMYLYTLVADDEIIDTKKLMLSK